MPHVLQGAFGTAQAQRQAEKRRLSIFVGDDAVGRLAPIAGGLQGDLAQLFSLAGPHLQPERPPGTFSRLYRLYEALCVWILLIFACVKRDSKL